MTTQAAGYAIVSPYGNVWTKTLFPTVDEASAYLRDFWGRTPWEPDKWAIAWAHVEIVVTGERHKVVT